MHKRQIASGSPVDIARCLWVKCGRPLGSNLYLWIAMMSVLQNKYNFILNLINILFYASNNLLQDLQVARVFLYVQITRGS